MSAIGMFVRIIFKLILPERVYGFIFNRVERTKKVMTRNLTLKIFWSILFFPLILPFSLIIALLKTIMIWTLSDRAYHEFVYAFKLFYTDITSKTERKSFRVALRRTAYFYELVTKGKERKTSFGEENPDVVFYVIRPYYFLALNEFNTRGAHLLYHYYLCLQNLAYAVEKGYVPVVDWENYGPFRHQEDYKVNDSRNCWEYYWNQPSNYTLSEVYRSKNVILSERNVKENEFVPSVFFRPPLQRQARDYALRCARYSQLFQFNAPTAAYISEKEQLLFPKNTRILGVSVRGTAYGATNVPRHPIQPDINDLINNIRQTMREWHIDYVFIACELEEIVNQVRQAFGDKTLVLQRLRYKEQPSEDNPLYVPGQRYQTNLDYLAEMALLSRCTALLAAMSSGTRAAIIWNANQYEHVKIYEAGIG